MFGIVGGLMNALTPSAVSSNKSRVRRSLSPAPSPAQSPPPSVVRAAAAPYSSESTPEPVEKRRSTTARKSTQSKAKNSKRRSSPSPQKKEDDMVLYNGEIVDSMLYVDVKSVLKELGLSCQGKKAVLVERLKEHLAASPSDATVSTPSARGPAEEVPVHSHNTRHRGTTPAAVREEITPQSVPSRRGTAAKKASADREKSPPATQTRSTRKRRASAVDTEEKPQKTIKTTIVKARKPAKAVRIAEVDDESVDEGAQAMDVELTYEEEPPVEPEAPSSTAIVVVPPVENSESDSDRVMEAVTESDADDDVKPPAVQKCAVVSTAVASASGVSLSADLLKILSSKFESTLRGEGTLTDTEYNMFQLLLEQSRAKPSSEHSVRFAPEAAGAGQSQHHVRFQGTESTASSASEGAYDTAPTPMPGRVVDRGTVEHNTSNAGVTPFGRPLSSQRYAGHTPFVPRRTPDTDTPLMTSWSQQAMSAASTPLRVPEQASASRTDSYEMQVDSEEKASDEMPEIPSPVLMQGRWSSGSRESVGVFTAGRDSYGLWQSNSWQQSSATKKRDNSAAGLNETETFPDSEFRAPKRQQVSFDAAGGEHRYVSVTEPPKNLRFSMGSVPQPAAYTPSFKVNAASVARHTGGLESHGDRKLYPFNSVGAGSSSPHWAVGRSNFSNSTPLSVKSRAQMLTASASRRKLIRNRLETGLNENSHASVGSVAPAASAVVAKRILETLGEMVTPLEEERARHPVSKLYKDAENPIDKKSEKVVKFLASTEESKPQVAFAPLAPAVKKVDESVIVQSPTVPEKKLDSVLSFGLSGKSVKIVHPVENNEKEQPAVSFRGSEKTAIPSPSASSEFKFGNPVPVSGIDEDISGPEVVNLKKRLSGAGRPASSDDAIRFVFSPAVKMQRREKKNTKEPSSSVAPADSRKLGQDPVVTTGSSSGGVVDKPKTTTSIWGMVSDKIKCDTCLVQNEKTSAKCVSCETPLVNKNSVENNKTVEVKSTEKAAAAPNIWGMVSNKVKCNVCLVQNEKTATKCVSCESPLTTDKPAETNKSSTSNEAPATKPSGFSFGASSSTAETESKKEPISSGFSFGSSNPAPSSTAGSSGGFSFSAPAVPSKPEDDSSSKFSFTAPSFGAAPAKTPDSTEQKSSAPPMFGGFSSATASDSKEKDAVAVKPIASTGFSFSAPSFGAMPASGSASEKREADKQEDRDDVSGSKKRTKDNDEGACSSVGFSFSAPSVKPSSESKPAASGFSFAATSPAPTPSDSAKTAGPPTGSESASSKAPVAPSFQFSTAGTKNENSTSVSAPATLASTGFSFAGLTSTASKDDVSSTSAPVGGGSGGAFVFGGSTSQPTPSSSSLTGGALSSAAAPSTNTAAPFTFGAVPSASESKPVDTAFKAPDAPFVFGAAPAAPSEAPKIAAPPVASAPFSFGATSSASRATPPSAFGATASSPSGMDYSSGGENSNFAAPQTTAPPPMFGSSNTAVAGIGMLQNNAPSSSAPTFGGGSGVANFGGSGSAPSFGAPSSGPVFGATGASSFGAPSGLNPAGGSSNSLSSAPTFGASSAPQGGFSAPSAPFIFGAAPSAAPQGQQFPPPGGGMGSSGGWGGASSGGPAPAQSGGGGMFSMGAASSNQGGTGPGAPRRKLKAKRNNNA